MAMTKGDFDRLRCPCGKTAGEHAEGHPYRVEMRAACHRDAGVRAYYAHGRVSIHCGECGRNVVDIAVAPTEAPTVSSEAIH